MSVSASPPPALPTLAAQPLPRHVRHLLGSMMKLAADELERTVNATVTDFEQQIIRQVERASFGANADRWRSVLSEIERARPQLVQDFLAALEAELASLQQPQLVRGQLQTRYQGSDDLALGMALVNDQEIEETSALTDAAMRAELQNSLPLFLLGQRFGVLAGRPAFDAESLPVGPQGLCRSIRHAVEKLGLDVDSRLMFYRSFERQVMPPYGSLVEVLNAELTRNGVLPNLQYVPVRARRTAQRPAEGGDATPRGDAAARVPRGAPPTPGSPEADAAAVPRGGTSADEGIALLRALMTSRRQLLGKLHPDRLREGREATRVASSNELQDVLRTLQSRGMQPMLGKAKSSARQVAHLKQDLLAMLRRTASDEVAPELGEEQSDAIDVVGMLYENLMRGVKPGSPAAGLLSKLQVPLIRVALQEPGFPTQPEHPARQLLNTVAETGLNWLGEDEQDTSLATQLHSIVDRVMLEYRGDSGVFREVQQELQQHLQTLARKAEVAERRHVEAARGREKLTLAREHAAECMEELLKEKQLPRFTRSMLVQAWADVMALTSLRQGRDSPEWQRQMDVAKRLIELAQRPADQIADAAEADIELKRELEDGLTRVGYQGDDVSAIAARLVHPISAQQDDASSRTELTMRLKARARLGEDLSTIRARSLPLTSAEQAEMERLKETPVGSWFEFTEPDKPDAKLKLRLAWLSPVTGDVLFVNQRGQKSSDYSLAELSRMIAKGQARILDEEKGTIIDRCWEGVMTALQSFAVPTDGTPPP